MKDERIPMFDHIGVIEVHDHSIWVWYDHENQTLHAKCTTCMTDLYCLSTKNNELSSASRTLCGAPAPCESDLSMAKTKDPNGWFLRERARCDLCHRVAVWEHPKGGLRCDKCPRPGEEKK